MLIILVYVPQHGIGAFVSDCIVSKKGYWEIQSRNHIWTLDVYVDESDQFSRVV